MKIGLVGYGAGGRYFHAPFISAAQGLDLVGIVARAPETIANAKADYPGVAIYPSLSAMLDVGVDIVTITTPPQTRRELVLEAIAAGVAVVADKPFSPDAKTGRELAEAAEAKGVILSIFHNRRFDADILTLRKVLEQQRVGKLWRFHNRMDLDDPLTLDGGETGGILRDLGSHLVDQTLWLLGPVTTVYANLDFIECPEGLTDASFTLTLTHANGVHSHLSSTKLNRITRRELTLYGEDGSYTSNGTDVQAQAILAGKRPADDLAAWGYEQPAHWGMLRTVHGEETIPSEQGCYHAYYQAMAEAVRTGGVPPVTAEQAIHTLDILDAAIISAREKRLVTL